jgi:hypothetical protein
MKVWATSNRLSIVFLNMEINSLKNSPFSLFLDHPSVTGSLNLHKTLKNTLNISQKALKNQKKKTPLKTC